MKLSFATLDVFTSTAFSGNPVAIVHIPVGLRDQITPEQKQKIAREFNLSESVFLHEQTAAESHSGDVKIDIFTPIAEVPFAGHPTIGTSNYLLRYLKDSPGWANIKALQAKAGRMPIEIVSALPGTGTEGVQLAVAHNVHRHTNRLGSEETLSTLPVDAREGFAIEQYPIVSSVRGMTFLLVQLNDLNGLKNKPKQNLIGTQNSYTCQHLLDEGWQAGILVSYFFVDLGTDEQGVRSLRTRMMGSREDPATGSAASALCAHLSLTEKGQQTRRFMVTQGVEMGRKSDIGVQVKLKADGSAVEELILSGSAVKVMEGFVELHHD